MDCGEPSRDARQAVSELARKLVAVLGMLGSDFDGERANAGRQADKMVRAAGLTWEDVVNGALAARKEPPQEPPKKKRGRPPAPPPAWHRTLQYCLDMDTRCQEALGNPLYNTWSFNFLDSIQKYRRLTDKQAEVLNRLFQEALEANRLLDGRESSNGDGDERATA